MSKILRTGTFSVSANEIWDGEYKSDAGKWSERLSKEELMTDSDWEWGQVVPDWTNQLERMTVSCFQR